MAVHDSCLMGWDENKSRWTKMHRGVTFRVTCTELGAPPSKTASYRQANAWWEAKLAEIDAPPKAPIHPHQEVIDHYQRRADWARQQGLNDLVLSAEVNAGAIRLLEPDDPLVTGYIQSHAEDIEKWSKVIGDVPPADRTIEALSKRFLQLSETRVQDGDLSPSEHDLACRCVQHFVGWLGVADPAHITAEKWEDYWKHLRKLIGDRKRSREYCKKDWRYARAFLEWMISMDKMLPLRNLQDKRYKIGETRKSVLTFTDAEIKQLIEGATGQLKLNLVLMINCGFYQSDISDLRKDEVDLERGYITRQRSKTRQHHGDKVPTVSYKLWPLTLELLKVHLSDHPTLALTTLQGKTWVETKVEGNRIKGRRDGIKSNFAHLGRRIKIHKPLKSFRKSSATKLDSDPRYARFARHFLGHAGGTTAEEHYLNRDGVPFDEAVLWLGSQYGF